VSLDLPPLRGADRNLGLSPERRADQHYQELASERAYGQWKFKQTCIITRFCLKSGNGVVQHCFSAVKRMLSLADGLLIFFLIFILHFKIILSMFLIISTHSCFRVGQESIFKVRCLDDWHVSSRRNYDRLREPSGRSNG